MKLQFVDRGTHIASLLHRCSVNDNGILERSRAGTRLLISRVNRMVHSRWIHQNSDTHSTSTADVIYSIRGYSDVSPARRILSVDW